MRKYLFRKRGEVWTIAFQGDVIYLRDAKGLHYIAALLACPGSRVHAADLRERVATPKPVADTAERARLMVTQRIKAAVQKIEASSPALGEHFRNSIHTGHLCRYDPPRPVPWNV